MWDDDRPIQLCTDHWAVRAALYAQATSLAKLGKSKKRKNKEDEQDSSPPPDAASLFNRLNALEKGSAEEQQEFIGHLVDFDEKCQAQSAWVLSV